MPDYIVVWHDGNGQINRDGVTRVSEQEYLDLMDGMAERVCDYDGWVCAFPVNFIPEEVKVR